MNNAEIVFDRDLYEHQGHRKGCFTLIRTINGRVTASGIPVTNMTNARQWCKNHKIVLST